MTELHEADAIEAAETARRFPGIVKAYEARFGSRAFTCHPNPLMTDTHAFCDFLERCIRDGVQVTKEVVSREFGLPESAWNW